MGGIGEQHHIAIETSASEYDIDAELLLESFTGKEAISELYNFQLKVLCTKVDIDPIKIVGKKMSVSIAYSGDASKKRFFNGYVKRIKAGETFTTLAHSIKGSCLRRYEIELVPWLWFLTQNCNNRVFQDKTVIEIIEKILEDHQGIAESNWDLVSGIVGAHPKRNICVQHQESDFDFISRLLEDEGIFFYFRHADDGSSDHTWVLCDDVSAYKFNPAKPTGDDDCNIVEHRQGSGIGEQISQWQHQYELQTGGVLLHDYDYNLAAAELAEPSAPSATKLGSKFPAVAEKTETYEYPGKYSCLQEGESAASHKSNLAQWRAEEIEADYDVVSAKSNSRNIHPCGKFTTAIEDCDWESNGDYEEGYVVRSVTHYAVDTSYHTGDGNTVGMKAATAINQIATAAMTSDASQQSLIDVLKHLADALADPDTDADKSNSTAQYHNRFDAMPAKVVFRPPRKTPKPKVFGLQTAVVTGAGDIDTDSQGRVQVRFHWEREDRKGSTWVRVSQMWAGKDWGGQHIPHVGQEVLVDFIQGDPDLPVIIGRVYNNQYAQPLNLPADKTKSIIRDYGANEMIWEGKEKVQHMWLHQACDNELWMEGKKGKEEISLKQKCNNELSMCATEPSISLEQACGNELYMTGKGPAKIQLTQECGNELLMEEDGAKITLQNPDGDNSIVMDQAKGTITMYTKSKNAKLILGGDKGYSMKHDGDWFNHTFGKKVNIVGGVEEAVFYGGKNSNNIGVDLSENLSFAESKNIGDRFRESKRAMTYSAKKSLKLQGGANADCFVAMDAQKIENKAGSTKFEINNDGDVELNTKKKFKIKAKTQTHITSNEIILKAKTIDLTKALVKHKNIKILS